MSEHIMSDLRVGIVTFISITCLVIAVAFAGGDKGLLLQKSTTLKAHLNDISGLKKGSTVTLGGMSIGKVTDVQLLDGNGENLIEVTMEIRSNVLVRIKADSKAAVRTQGMLGDRYIEISMGSQEAAPFDPAIPLLGNGGSNFDDALYQATETLTQTTKMLEAINQQQGSMGHFVYDEQFYNKLLAITTQVQDLLKDFKQNPRRYVKLSVF